MTTRIARYLFGVDDAVSISTTTINSQHWYAAVDICRILGIENHSQAVHRERATDAFSLMASEWKKKTIYNGSSKRRMLMVNDNGMLKLILQGTSERAKDVQALARQTPANLIPAIWMPRTAEN